MVLPGGTAGQCYGGAGKRCAISGSVKCIITTVTSRLGWAHVWVAVSAEGQLKLSRVTVEGYRSIRGPIEFVVDERVSILLGANDHGKTNLLRSLLHLNSETTFTDEDLNWDSATGTIDLPRLQYTFTLTDAEAKGLREIENRRRRTDYLTARLLDIEDHIRALEAESADLERPSEPADEADIQSQESDEPDSSAAPRKLERDNIQDPVADLRLSRLVILLALAAIQPNGEEWSAEVELESVKRSIQRYSAVIRELETSLEEFRDESVPADEEESHTKSLADLDDQIADAQDEVAVLEGRKRDLEGILRLSPADVNAAAALRIRPLPSLLRAAETPTAIVLSRKGIGGNLVPEAFEPLSGQSIADFIATRLPRVELIEPFQEVSDSVSRSELEDPAHLFMRGILEYAGIQQSEWDDLFEQNPRTLKRLDDASAQLNRVLKSRWVQGRELDFILRHDSGAARISFAISDPSVMNRYVKASQRSSGFTHFFALRAILHAREAQSPAASHLWLFDEPGIYLHPEGQHDLLKVLETIADTNQVVYTTHSLFMINRNYPFRHRLVAKTGAGTGVDHKPFLGRWRSTLRALGLALPGTILFAPTVLLAEGDADVILFGAVFQRLVATGKVKVDINGLGIMGTGDVRTAEALIRMLCEAEPRPRLAHVVDGDSGGTARERALDAVLKEFGVEHRQLTKGASAEDYLPGGADTYLRATARFAASIAVVVAKEEQILADLRNACGSEDSVKKMLGIANWVEEHAPKLIDGLNEPLSKVGIARETCKLIEDTETEWPKSDPGTVRAVDLLKWVAQALDLPDLRAIEDRVLEPAGE